MSPAPPQIKVWTKTPPDPPTVYARLVGAHGGVEMELMDSVGNRIPGSCLLRITSEGLYRVWSISSTIGLPLSPHGRLKLVGEKD